MNRSQFCPTTTRRSNDATWSFLKAACVCLIAPWLAGCGGTDDAKKAPTASSDKSAESTPANNAASSSVATPEATKPKPPAEPEVAVDETPRPPATVEQAAKLLDLRTFPVLKGAHIRSPRQSIGELYYSAPDNVATAFKFQCVELKKRGWKELPGTRDTGENPAATFTQQGFIVYVSVSSYGRGPNGESGWSSISLGNQGNVLTGKLPVPKGAEPHYSTITQASYVTKAPLGETAQACKQLLLQSGWQPYGENTRESPVSNSHTLEFKQNAVLLSANISDHSNQPGKTFISYTTKQLTADIPAPPGAPDFRYTDSDKRMHFDTEDSAQDVAAHYVKALGKLGWKPTTEELLVKNLIRELVRRLKKIGWNWSDAGAARMGRIVMVRRYDQEKWEEYWKKRMNLQGRCTARLTRCEYTLCA